MNKKEFLKLHLAVHFFMVLLFFLVVFIYGPTRFTYQISRILPIDNKLKQNIVREYYKSHYSSLNEKEANGGIVFLGNSTIYRYPLEEHFSDHHVINRGIEGDTTVGVLERLESNVLNLRPSKVFIMVGLNDILTGFDEERIINNFTSIIRQIGEKSPDTRIYIKSILPLSRERADLISVTDRGNITAAGAAKIAGINELLSSLAGQHRSVEYIDIYRLFADSEGFLDRKYTEDGQELNTAAYALMTEELKKYLGMNIEVASNGI